MALYYITGTPGAGKSTVFNELIKRGVTVFGTDEHNLAAHYHNQTGEKVASPRSTERSPEWSKQHSYKVLPETIKNLKSKSKSSDIFVIGVTANEHEYLNLFDHVFALWVDLPTTKHRIINRTNNEYGKAPHEMQNIEKSHKAARDWYQNYGITVIDSNRPVQNIVDDILNYVKK